MIDLHNWNTIEELARHEGYHTGIERRRDEARSGTVITYSRSRAEGFLPDTLHLADELRRSYMKVYRRLVRDHVRPCV